MADIPRLRPPSRFLPRKPAPTLPEAVEEYRHDVDQQKRIVKSIEMQFRDAFDWVRPWVRVFVGLFALLVFIQFLRFLHGR